MKTSFSNRAGFTLVEILLVITVFVVVAGTSGMMLTSFLSRTQFNAYSEQAVQALRRAQSNALARYGDDPWGVRLDPVSRSWVLFKGDSYAVRDPSFDEVTFMPSSLAFADIQLNGGGTDILFSSGDGTTTTSGSFQLQQLDERSVTITVNAYGQIKTDP